MNILTKQDKANKVAERWKKAYYSTLQGKWVYDHYKDKEAIYTKLLDLGDTPSPTDIDAAIGNSSWTRLTCDCCEAEVDTVVQFKAIAHDEYGDTELCKECVTKIAKLIDLQVLL